MSTSEGCGSEKPEQAQFSLTLHFTCNEKINPIYSQFKNTQRYEQNSKNSTQSPRLHYRRTPRCSRRSRDDVKDEHESHKSYE